MNRLRRPSNRGVWAFANTLLLLMSLREVMAKWNVEFRAAKIPMEVKVNSNFACILNSLWVITWICASRFKSFLLLFDLWYTENRSGANMVNQKKRSRVPLRTYGKACATWRSRTPWIMLHVYRFLTETLVQHSCWPTLQYRGTVFFFYVCSSNLPTQKTWCRRCNNMLGHLYECSGVASWHSSASISEFMKGSEMASHMHGCTGISSCLMCERSSEGMKGI